MKSSSNTAGEKSLGLGLGLGLGLAHRFLSQPEHLRPAVAALSALACHQVGKSLPARVSTHSASSHAHWIPPLR